MYRVNSLNSPLGRKKMPRARFMAVLFSDCIITGGNGQGSSGVGTHKLDCPASSCSVVTASDHERYHALSARAFSPATPREHSTSLTTDEFPLSSFGVVPADDVVGGVKLRPDLHAGAAICEVKMAPPRKTK